MQYNIIFFGTSEFACHSIELLSKHHNLIALVTSPNPSPAKELARKSGIKVFEPLNPNSQDFLRTIKNLNPDILCLAAYGHILSPEILNLPNLASINLHPSLLPKYRGAAPIQWAIINGEKYTGVSTLLIDPKIDHGDILLQKRIEIKDSETLGELEEKLSKIGAPLLLETINNLKKLKPVSQLDEETTYAPKITKEMRRIDWHCPATEIVNLIRALSPKPLAYTIFRNRQLEILFASKSDSQGDAGKIIKARGTLLLGTNEGCVELKILKPEAKREQSAIDFINGYRPKVGETMG
ncbi:methionyl-tRNA formyltransferase [candidate division WOR-3 bacterium]|nr:methionyl-tRNA formyltransferase [candidate division WOR-3 bacterium]